MTRTTTTTAAAGRHSRPEPRNAVPVFLNDGEPLVVADSDTRPELFPAADAFGRTIGNLVPEDGRGEGDAKPTHAPLTAPSIGAELAPDGIYRTADGRMFALCRLETLGGAKMDSAPVGVYLELNPAAPVGAVWDALFRPAFPDGEE